MLPSLPPLNNRTLMMHIRLTFKDRIEYSHPHAFQHAWTIVDSARQFGTGGDFVASYEIATHRGLSCGGYAVGTRRVASRRCRNDARHVRIWRGIFGVHTGTGIFFSLHVCDALAG